MHFLFGAVGSYSFREEGLGIFFPYQYINRCNSLSIRSFREPSGIKSLKPATL